MGVIVVPQHHAPSARARALADVLADTIQEYRRANGDITSYEIQQAVQVTLAKSLEGQRGNPALAAVFLGAVAAAGGMIAFVVQNQSGSGREALIVLPIVVVIIAVVFVVRLRRG